jgi:(E)-4-hydroxy-3-methylbut-2-enyl-diphosphate synthase
VLKEVASLLPAGEAKLVYPEGGIKEIAGTHRTRDEGTNLPILQR